MGFGSWKTSSNLSGKQASDDQRCCPAVFSETSTPLKEYLFPKAASVLLHRVVTRNDCVVQGRETCYQELRSKLDSL